MKFLFRLENDESYDFLEKEKERRKQLEKERAEEENSSTELNEKEIVKVEEIINVEKINLNENLTKTDLKDDSINLKNEILLGFKKLNVKIYLLSGDIESIFKKKKFSNLFDFILLGFHSKNIFKNAHLIGKKDMKLLVELNSFMTTFKEKERTTYKEKIKEMASESNLILEDTSSKYIWKFFYKMPSEERTIDLIDNNINSVAIENN
jgi:hypothetical protein